MACPTRGKIGENNIVVQSPKKVRYQCNIYGKTFAATSDTLFNRLHHPVELVVIGVTLIAYSCLLQAIVGAFHLDKRMMMEWKERVGRHGQRVHEHLV